MGAGAGKRVSAVRWGVAGNIVVAWFLTLPAAAAIGAACYGFTSIFGDGAAGPVILSGAGDHARPDPLRPADPPWAAGAAGMSAAALIQVLPATVIDGEALLDTAVASLVAGIFVTFTASLAIYGFATAAEMRRVDRDLAAVGAGALGGRLDARLRGRDRPRPRT